MTGKSLSASVAEKTARKNAANHDRWWATYNAALSGLYACSSFDIAVEGFCDTGHRLATAAANRAHGQED